MPSRKPQVNVRLSPLGKDVLHFLQAHYGVSQAAVFEMLLRDKARSLGQDPAAVRRPLTMVR